MMYYIMTTIVRADHHHVTIRDRFVACGIQCTYSVLGECPAVITLSTYTSGVNARPSRVLIHDNVPLIRQFRMRLCPFSLCVKKYTIHLTTRILVHYVGTILYNICRFIGKIKKIETCYSLHTYTYNIMYNVLLTGPIYI